MSQRSFVDEVDRVLSWAKIEHAVVAVTEPYARRVLKLKKKQPVRYRDVDLTCIGSRAWRERVTEHGQRSS